MIKKVFGWLNLKRAQNTAEYAILIGTIVAAAIAMQVYVRRSVQARIKEAVDFPKKYVNENSGDEGASFFENSQYEPYYSRTNIDTTENGRSREEMQQGGGVVRTVEGDAVTRQGNQVYSSYLDNSAWFPGRTGTSGTSGGSTGGGGECPAPCI